MKYTKLSITLSSDAIRIRTETVQDLNLLPLPLGYRAEVRGEIGSRKTGITCHSILPIYHEFSASIEIRRGATFAPRPHRISLGGYLLPHVPARRYRASTGFPRP